MQAREKPKDNFALKIKDIIKDKIDVLEIYIKKIVPC